MRKLILFAFLFAFSLAFVTLRAGDGPPASSSAGGTQDVAVIHAEIVATGIPGAGAIAQVGTFHKGGPFVERPGLVTAAHPVLDERRLLVASTSNFGATPTNPPAGSNAPDGSILSLDVSDLSGGPLVVPSGFAATGGQAHAFGNAVILYTAQSAPFLNSVKNGADATKTKDLTAVSLPLDI